MKKQFNCLLDEEVVAEIKRRAVGKVTQAEVVTKAILGEEAQGQIGGQLEDRLKNVEAMVGRLVETMDRLVELMVVADMDQAASELAEPKVSQEGARPPYPPEYTPGGALDPKKLGLTPEQVKSFGLKTGADLQEPEELPDDPQTPVPPEDEPAKPENQIRGVSKKEGGKVMGKIIDEIREDLPRTIGIPIAHLLTKAEPKPVVPQFNQVLTIDRRRPPAAAETQW